MAKFHKLSKEDREIGMALAERAKLDPAITLEDYTVDSHGDTVTIRFEAIHQMPRAEFEALIASLQDRQVIPAQAVEAAARAAVRADLQDWDSLTDLQRQQYTHIVEAAAPFLLAAGWHEGVDYVRECGPDVFDDNPYRRQA